MITSHAGEYICQLKSDNKRRLHLYIINLFINITNSILMQCNNLVMQNLRKKNNSENKHFAVKFIKSIKIYNAFCLNRIYSNVCNTSLQYFAKYNLTYPMSPPGSQWVSMPSFMLIGPKLWSGEGFLNITRFVRCAKPDRRSATLPTPSHSEGPKEYPCQVSCRSDQNCGQEWDS